MHYYRLSLLVQGSRRSPTGQPHHRGHPAVPAQEAKRKHRRLVALRRRRTHTPHPTHHQDQEAVQELQNQGLLPGQQIYRIGSRNQKFGIHAFKVSEKRQ